jgi:hypothetical protein
MFRVICRAPLSSAADEERSRLKIIFAWQVPFSLLLSILMPEMRCYFAYATRRRAVSFSSPPNPRHAYFCQRHYYRYFVAALFCH